MKRALISVFRVVFVAGATYIGFMIGTAGALYRELYGTHWIHYSAASQVYYPIYVASLIGISAASLVLFFDRRNRHLAMGGLIIIVIGFLFLNGSFTFVRERN